MYVAVTLYVPATGVAIAQLYKVVTPFVTVEGLEVQPVAAPVTVQVTVPVTGTELEPVSKAVTVTSVPTVVPLGDALTNIEGVATERFTETIDEVAAL